MPITGMTLPFVSYGGSSLVSTWLMVGVLLNIGLRRPQPFTKESFEFDDEEDEA
jgi:cell division protein FtsW (lipid II flippase)